MGQLRGAGRQYSLRIYPHCGWCVVPASLADLRSPPRLTPNKQLAQSLTSDLLLLKNPTAIDHFNSMYWCRLSMTLQITYTSIPGRSMIRNSRGNIITFFSPTQRYGIHRVFILSSLLDFASSRQIFLLSLDRKCDSLWGVSGLFSFLLNLSRSRVWVSGSNTFNPPNSRSLIFSSHLAEFNLGNFKQP